MSAKETVRLLAEDIKHGNVFLFMGKPYKAVPVGPVVHKVQRITGGNWIDILRSGGPPSFLNMRACDSCNSHYPDKIELEQETSPEGKLRCPACGESRVRKLTYAQEALEAGDD